MSKIIVSAVFTFENGNFELSPPVLAYDVKTAMEAKDQYLDQIEKMPWLKQLDVYIDKYERFTRLYHFQWRKANGK